MNWILQNINQDFCQAFRETYNSNGFPTVKEVIKKASDIYNNRNGAYSSKKSTVSSRAGVKKQLEDHLMINSHLSYFQFYFKLHSTFVLFHFILFFS